MIIHGDLGSGNCLKVKWTADYLRLPYTWAPVNIMKGEARTSAFAAMNPAMQTPVVDFGGGKYLSQSNAIIRYLARGTALLPDDAWTQAKIDQWLFWEQYSHEPNVATCRFHMHPAYLGKSKETRDPDKVVRGEKALDLMEAHLAAAARRPATPSPSPPGGGESVRSSARPQAPIVSADGHPNVPSPLVGEGQGGGYLVGDTLTIADIALLAYTRLAHEGGFDLCPRPQIRKWIAASEQHLRLN